MTTTTEFASMLLSEVLSTKAGREWFCSQPVTDGMGNAHPIGTLPARGPAYAIGYGYSKSLQDSVAGDKARILGTAKTDNWSFDQYKEVCEDYNLPVGTWPCSEAEADTILNAFRQDRFNDINAGTLGQRGPRAKSGEKLFYDLVEELLAADFAKRGKAAPKWTVTYVNEHGKTAEKAMPIADKRARLQGILDNPKNAAFASRVKAEHDRRLAAAAGTATDVVIDLD